MAGHIPTGTRETPVVCTCCENPHHRSEPHAAPTVRRRPQPPAAIYPVPVKPASAICTWSAWPDDVRDIIRRWNKRPEVDLSFVRTSHTFKCVDCEAFCQAHANGAAVFNAHRQLDRQEWTCDDCLIARARAFAPVIDHLHEARRAGVYPASCTCTSRWSTDDHSQIRPECPYHQAAAAFPLDHGIPWNCGHYWDGCNCTRPNDR